MGGKVGRGVDPGNGGKGIFPADARKYSTHFYVISCCASYSTFQGRERTVPGGRGLPRSSVFALRLVSAKLVGEAVGPPILTQGEKERH